MSITSENIRFYRNQHNLTQHQLAALTNVSRSTIASYESGRTEPDIASLQTFSHIFHISIDDLLSRSQAAQIQRNTNAKKLSCCFIGIINLMMLFRNIAISILSHNNIGLPVGTPLGDAQLQTLYFRNILSNAVVVLEGITVVLCIAFYCASFIKRKRNDITIKFFVLVNALPLSLLAAQTLLFVGFNPRVAFYDYFHLIQSIGLYTIVTYVLLLVMHFIFKISHAKGNAGG